MTSSKILFYFCLSFIFGIFFSSVIKIPQSLLWGFLSLGVLLIFSQFFLKKENIFLIGFCILFLVLGISRHQAVLFEIENNQLRQFNDSDQEITIIGFVSTEPDIRENSTKLTIKAFSVSSVEDGPLRIEGKVLLTTSKYPEYQYGDSLEIKGKLETPPVFEGFDYRNYLQKQGIYSVMSWPKTGLLGNNFGNPVMKILFSFKKKFQETSRVFIPPPQEGILEALAFGEESNISQDWKEKLNITGTRHIAAVSGMNITIIASLIFSFILSLGFWRQHAFYLTIFLLSLYILMIGFPASAARAGIMGILLLTAQHLGRLSTAQRAVIFAGFLMLLMNPLLLRFDIGFQLSFLATIGLIYLQPIFYNWFKKIPNPKLFPLRTVLSATLGAQVFTLPILVYNFGRIPLLSLIPNILIVPMLAPITILIFIFGLAGIIFWPLGFFLSLPVWFCLTYVVVLVDWFSKISFATLFVNVSWIWLIIAYLILGGLIWQLNRKKKIVFLLE